MSNYRDDAAGDRLRAQLTKKTAEGQHLPAGEHQPMLDDLLRTLDERGQYALARQIQKAAVVDWKGRVNVGATVIKIRRAQLLAKMGAKPASVGDVNAGPRGSGPAPRTPSQMPRMLDGGNGTAVAAPVPGVAQHDLPRLDPRHDPVEALRQLTAMTRAAHRKT